VKIYRIMVYIVIVMLCLGLMSFLYMKGIGNNKIEDMEGKPRIIMLAHIYQNPYWQIIKQGAEEAAKYRGCIIEYNGPQAASVEESLKLFDMAINAKVDGILTYVQDESLYAPYINKASSVGIPVITVDTDASKSERIAYVGTDNIYAGEAAAKILCDHIDGALNIGIVMGGPTTNQIERVDGFKKYISSYKDAKIVDTQSSDSYMVEARLMTEKMITNHPDINSIYCTSALDGAGAAKAIQKLNRTDIVIVCFDDLPETLDYIDKGIIYATIVQKPYEMGYKSVNLMMDHIENKSKVSGQYITDVEVITRDNLDDYIEQRGER
jgi:ribose transport system substrate-binding protein